MKTAILSVALTAALVATVSPSAHAQGGRWGTFKGTIVTEWHKDGRRMILREPIYYRDPLDVEWDAPAGWVVDGASIPPWAWSLIGGPFEGTYRDASIIHDVACDRKVRRWQDVHLAFYHAMLARGVDTLRAKIMYAAVYHYGPRWQYESKVGPYTMDRLGTEIDFFKQKSLRRGDNPSGVGSILNHAGSIPNPKYKPPPPKPFGGEGGNFDFNSSPSKEPPTLQLLQASVFILPATPQISTQEQMRLLKAEIESKNLTLEQIELFKPAPPGAPK